MMTAMKRVLLILTAAIVPAILVASTSARASLSPRVVSIYSQIAIAHDVSQRLTPSADAP